VLVLGLLVAIGTAELSVLVVVESTPFVMVIVSTIFN
jgi:hypothetical protein